MTYNITETEDFDHKRTKVTLDYGEVTFLLYKGEFRQLHLHEKRELTQSEYESICQDILIPRAKKRVLYYMKNADKTRQQIRDKLKEGYYPEDVISEVEKFLDKYGFADDQNYAAGFIEGKKRTHSRRELAMKLREKGVDKETLREALDALTPEDEAAACRRAFQKKYPHGLPEDADPAERRKAAQYLARKGYAFDVIRRVISVEDDIA